VALRDKNIWACVITPHRRGLAPKRHKKAGSFQIRLPPPVAFSDKLCVVRFETTYRFFFLQIFCVKKSKKKSLEITREFHPDDAGLDNDIVKRAARWC
jgi:hypothetical protein